MPQAGAGGGEVARPCWWEGDSAHCGVSEGSCREHGAETLVRVPNAHAGGSVIVLYTIKYIYTFICLMLFIYAEEKKKVFINHFGEVCIHCANNRVSLCQSHRY